MFVLGVPRCNEPAAIFAETLRAALAGTSVPTHALIVDNGDAPLGEAPGFVVDRPGNNVGCAGAWNRLLRRAFDELEVPTAIVLNGDCAVAPDTFERMLASDRRVVCAQGFSCFRIDESVWRTVGEFDEEYYPVYWEDTDYRRRLALVGEPIDEWPLPEVERPSFGRAKYGSGITHGWRLEDAGYQGWTGEKLAWFYKRWEANRDRYAAKWGGLPGEEQFTVPFGQVNVT